MTNYSLHAHMMILILAPTILIGLLLSIFFIMHHYNNLQHQLEDASASIIEPLAVSTEYGMSLQNHESISQLISILHHRHSNIVHTISVYDENNQLFVTSNFHLDPSSMQLSSNMPFPHQLTVTHDSNIMILHTPIISESYSPNKSPSSNAKNSQNMLGYIALELDLKSVHLQQYKEIFISSMMMLFCISIALIFGWHLMHNVTSPIHNMVNTINHIHHRQLNSQVEGFMLSELDMLKNSINSMAMSLAAYHKEMQHNINQATSNLHETLEQIEIQNIELDLAKKHAQEAAHIKSKFLANMSHKLHTPLNGVIGFTHLTLKTELTPTQHNHLNTIEHSANNLLAIINDVLNFSKLEAGKLILESIPFPLHSTLDEVITLLAHSSHNKGLELTLNIKSNMPDNMISDPLQLQQIITNLVGNAIKFTKNGNIDILVEKHALSNTKVQIEVQIQDTSIGIPEHDQSRLFQAFQQADASISHHHGGTRLGLVITQKLVNEMGSDISFHSQPNHSSTFWFHINLNLNPNIIIKGPSTQCLAGKHLAYVKPNSTAAQCTLDILSETPLEVVYSPTFSTLPPTHYNMMLLGITVTFHEPLTMQHEQLAKAVSMTNFLMLALPCHAQVNAEKLKQDGISTCLLKPLTPTHLLPALTEFCHHKQNTLLPATNESKLAMTVMAVDDNPTNLKLISTLLEDMVQHVELCNSRHQAVEQAKQMPFNLILMDIQMPDMDGIQACKLIHQLPHQQQTPVITVTAHAMARQKEKLLGTGMSNYLAKPIEEEQLHNLLLHYKPGSSISSHIMTPKVNKIVVNPNATLNWQLALHQAAGKTNLAHNMLQMLLNFLPEVHNKVEEQLVGENPEGLVDLIHKLHGSCSYSSVPHMKNLCQLIKQQLHSSTKEEDLEPELLELLDKMDNVAHEASKILR